MQLTQQQINKINDFKEFAKTAVTKAGNSIGTELKFTQTLNGMITVQGKVLGVKGMTDPNNSNPLVLKTAPQEVTQDVTVEWNLDGQAFGNQGFSLVKVLSV